VSIAGRRRRLDARRAERGSPAVAPRETRIGATSYRRFGRTTALVSIVSAVVNSRPGQAIAAIASRGQNDLQTNARTLVAIGRMATAPTVTLREISASTVRAVIALSVRDDQRRFVATNAESLAEALFKKEAWYRAIYAGERPAGFVMLFDEALRLPPPHPRAALWPFMVDLPIQGRDIGSAAPRLVIDHVRSAGPYSSLQVSYFPGPGSPESFYRKFGFQPTGREDEREVIIELALTG
jgi:diamine N-acetyltransferase